MEILLGIVIVLVAIAFCVSIFAGADSIYKYASGQTAQELSEAALIQEKIHNLWENYYFLVKTISETKNEKLKELWLEDLDTVIINLECVFHQDVENAWRVYDELHNLK